MLRCTGAGNGRFRRRRRLRGVGYRRTRSSPRRGKDIGGYASTLQARYEARRHGEQCRRSPRRARRGWGIKVSNRSAARNNHGSHQNSASQVYAEDREHAATPGCCARCVWKSHEKRRFRWPRGRNDENRPDGAGRRQGTTIRCSVASPAAVSARQSLRDVCICPATLR